MASYHESHTCFCWYRFMSQWLTPRHSVLVADDDLDLLSLLGFALGTAGFDVDSTHNATEAIESYSKRHQSVLILDKEMPDMDGIEVCARIRETSSVPIVILSARKQEDDVLRALDAGADAYMTKPFSPRTLVAYIRALLRRAAMESASSLVSGQFRLDISSNILASDAGELKLTRAESRVLQLLIRNAGESVSSGALLDSAWDSGQASGRKKMLSQIIFRLRRKLAEHPQTAQAIVTTADGYLWNGKLVGVTGNITTRESLSPTPA